MNNNGFLWIFSSADMEGDEEAHELMNRLRFDELGELVGKIFKYS